MYTQCQLRNGNLYEVAYIPEQFAWVGAQLRIKNEGVWEEGWTVLEVYGSINPAQAQWNYTSRKRFEEVLNKTLI